MANTDFIDKIVAKEAYQDIEKTNALLDVLYDKFVKVAQAASAANDAIGGAGGMKELNTETKKVKEETDELEKIQKQIEQTIAKRIAAESKLAQELAKEKVLLQQVNKDNTNAAKINLTTAGSITRMEQVVIRLRAKQRDLNLETEEGQKKSLLYIKAIDNLNNKIKESSDAAAKQRLNVGNYQGSAKIIVDALGQVEKKIADLTIKQQGLQELGQRNPIGFRSQSGQEQLNTVTAQLQDAQKQAQALNSIVSQPKFLNIAANVGDTNKELRFFQQRLNELEDQGLKSSDVYKQVQKRLAELTDQIGDTREEIKAMSSDTRGFDLFAGSVAFAADTFQTFAGAAQLAGASEEDAAKATATLVAVQSVANGVKGIATELTTKGTAANKVYAFTQGLVATAFDKSAASAKRFYAALGIIGLIVTVIGAVALAMGELNRKLSDAEQKQKNLNDVIKESAGEYAKAKTEVAQMGKEIELAKKGVLDKETVLKHFNETIGETIGQTKSLEEAEKLLNDKKDEYVAMMFAKAQAAAGFALANKAAEESVKNEAATTEELLSTFDKVKAFFTGGGQFFAQAQALQAEENRIENRNKLQQDYNNFLEIGNQKLEEAGQISAANGFKSKEQLQIEEEKRKKAEAARKKAEEEAKKAAEKKKKLDEDLAEFGKKMAADEAKAKSDFLNNYDDEVANNLKRIVDNEKLSLNERMIANTAYYKAQEEAIRKKSEREQQAVIDAAKAEAEKILGRKLDPAKDAELILQIERNTANQRILIQQKAESEIVKARLEGIEKQNDLVEKSVEDQINALNIRTQNEVLAIDKAEQEKLLALDKKFAQGKINQEDYEKEKLRIQNEFIAKRIQAELSAAEEFLAIAKAAGTDTADAEKRIAELKIALEKNTNRELKELRDNLLEDEKSNQEKRKQLLTELYGEAKNLIFSFIDSTFEKQKNAVEGEKRLLEERKQAEIDRINALQIGEEKKAAMLQALDVKTENQRRILEQRQQALEARKARFTKGVQAAAAGGETIVKVASILGDAAKAKAQAALLAANPLTAAFAPIALASAGTITGLAILTGALGAANVARILATPIPEYYTGTEDSAGGVVWLGEKGKELLITPQGQAYETPGTATLANIPAHSKVINNEDYMEMLRSEKANSTLKVKPMSEEQFIKWQMKQAELETQKIVDAINNKPEAIFNISDYGIERYRKHMNSWTDYINRKVRFKR